MMINLTERTDFEHEHVTMKEFIATMNGPGYDDSAFEIAINPKFYPEDGAQQGWFFSFYDPIHRVAVVVCDVVKSDYFELDVRGIDELINIMASLADQSKKATIYFDGVNHKQ